MVVRFSLVLALVMAIGMARGLAQEAPRALALPDHGSASAEGAGDGRRPMVRNDYLYSQCIIACAGSPAEREAFCRTLPKVPLLRALCWKVVHESERYCINFCNSSFR